MFNGIVAVFFVQFDSPLAQFSGFRSLINRLEMGAEGHHQRLPTQSGI